MWGIGPSLAEGTRAVNADLHIRGRDILGGLEKKELINSRKIYKSFKGSYECAFPSMTKGDFVLIENLLKQEEIYWLQRGRANWLLHSDRNTSFFHNAATARKKRNQIKKLIDENGVWVQDT